jgi:pyruvate/2-oxoglutarate dehydrogenase complex dihydrolipoamide dehydrogenase (E3) component
VADKIDTDICVIGAGSGGLSVAAGAVQMGARVVLIEKAKMGGDCLNYGCVPSKSLIAAGHTAQMMRTSKRYGVNGVDPSVDFQAVHDHVHGVIGAIAPHDSVERFEGLGCTVIQAPARFTGPGEVEAGGQTIKARRFVIATGSAPVVPPTPGLEDVPYFTNETIFDLTEAPEHLIVIGGGPIGCEMAQAHRRLGSKVTQVSRSQMMPKDEPEATAIVNERFREEGIEFIENAEVTSIARDGNNVAVNYALGDKSHELRGSHLLIAVGRKVNVDGLNLEAAGIKYSPKGIDVDERLRTSNKKVFAIGDVAGSYQFTHMAGYHAGIVIRNALFSLPSKVNYSAVPWVTYTDPEVAHVGMTEAMARKKESLGVKALSWKFEENDRAQAERETDGFIKVVTAKNGRVLGATIVGLHAGEQLTPWILAISQKMKIGAMANIIVPYPTRAEVSKRVAGSYYTPSLFSDRTKKIVRFVQKYL